MVYRNTFHIIWYNITILWYGNIEILYCKTNSLLKYTYNTVGLRRISFFSEIRSPRSVRTFFAQTPPSPPQQKNAPAAQPLSACKERTIEEEIFDKSSDQISRLVNKIWLCRYPRCRYLIYDNGSEFKLHFVTLCDSYGIKRKPTTIKNPQANAICERVHQVLGTMIRTAE
jgi:hypothetical protein